MSLNVTDQSVVTGPSQVLSANGATSNATLASGQTVQKTACINFDIEGIGQVACYSKVLVIQCFTLVAAQTISLEVSIDGTNFVAVPLSQLTQTTQTAVFDLYPIVSFKLVASVLTANVQVACIMAF